MRRRVVQIEFIGPESSENMLALCSDGTLWRWRGYERGWSAIPPPPDGNSALPQPSREAA